MQEDLGVQRKIAAKYLNLLAEEGLLKKQKVSKTKYYLNEPLINLFLSTHKDLKDTEVVDSVHETKSE